MDDSEDLRARIDAQIAERRASRAASQRSGADQDPESADSPPVLPPHLAPARPWQKSDEPAPSGSDDPDEVQPWQRSAPPPDPDVDHDGEGAPIRPLDPARPWLSAGTPDADAPTGPRVAPSQADTVLHALAADLSAPQPEAPPRRRVFGRGRRPEPASAEPLPEAALPEPVAAGAGFDEDEVRRARRHAAAQERLAAEQAAAAAAAARQLAELQAHDTELAADLRAAQEAIEAERAAAAERIAQAEQALVAEREAAAQRSATAESALASERARYAEALDEVQRRSEADRATYLDRPTDAEQRLTALEQHAAALADQLEAAGVAAEEERQAAAAELAESARTAETERARLAEQLALTERTAQEERAALAEQLAAAEQAAAAERASDDALLTALQRELDELRATDAQRAGENRELAARVAELTVQREQLAEQLAEAERASAAERDAAASAYAALAGEREEIERRAEQAQLASAQAQQAAEQAHAAEVARYETRIAELDEQRDGLAAQLADLRHSALADRQALAAQLHEAETAYATAQAGARDHAAAADAERGRLLGELEALARTREEERAAHEQLVADIRAAAQEELQRAAAVSAAAHEQHLADALAGLRAEADEALTRARGEAQAAAEGADRLAAELRQVQAALELERRTHAEKITEVQQAAQAELDAAHAAHARTLDASAAALRAEAEAAVAQAQQEAAARVADSEWVGEQQRRAEAAEYAQQIAQLRTEVGALTARVAAAERRAADERHSAEARLAAARVELEQAHRATADLERRLAEATAVRVPAVPEAPAPVGGAPIPEAPVAPTPQVEAAPAAATPADARGLRFGRRREIGSPVEPRHAAQRGEPSFADLTTPRRHTHPRPPASPQTRPPARPEQPARWEIGERGRAFFERPLDEDDARPARTVRNIRLVPELTAKWHHRLTILARLLVVVTLAALAAMPLRAYVIMPYYIPSASMEPTLHGCQGCDNDRVLVDKLAYHLHAVHRGDVVVFDRPASWHGIPEKTLIKRVIGLPGETLTASAGHVYIDGRLLHEPYVNKDCKQGTTFPQSSYTVPKGDVFVMGDNRCFSDDSRMQTAVPENDIVGRAFVIIWPLGRIHYL